MFQALKNGPYVFAEEKLQTGRWFCVSRCLRKRKDVTARSRRKRQATFQAWHTCRRWSPSSTTRKYPRDTSAIRSDDFSDAQSRSLARAKIIIAFVSTK